MFSFWNVNKVDFLLVRCSTQYPCAQSWDIDMKTWREIPHLHIFYSQFNPRGGGTPRDSWWRCAARVFKSRPYFRPKHAIFHTHFQTWPLKFIPVFRPELANIHPFSDMALYMVFKWQLHDPAVTGYEESKDKELAILQFSYDFTLLFYFTWDNRKYITLCFKDLNIWCSWDRDWLSF